MKHLPVAGRKRNPQCGTPECTCKRSKEAAMERTFAMLKPDAVGRGKAGALLHLIENHNFRIVGMKMTQLGEGAAAILYQAHAAKDFFRDLVAFTTSGPVVLLVLEKTDAIANFRQVVTEKIRPTFGTSVRENAVHGSDSPDAARRELELFFPELT